MLIISAIFRLSIVRSLAPLAATFALNFLQIGLAIALLRPFVAEAFVTPSPGMMPTINPGDHFVAEKMIAPHHFDLVVFRARLGNDEVPHPYCKRLIAFPGERLRFEGGNIYINDKAVAMPAVLAGRCHAAGKNWAANLVRYHDGQTIILRPDDYFYLGDNIDFSYDSRIAGPMPRSSLIGVVDLTYWPLAKFHVWR